MTRTPQWVCCKIVILQQTHFLQSGLQSGYDMVYSLG